MLPSFAKQTVTILRAPVTRDQGTDYPDWGNAHEFDQDGCIVVFGATTDEARLFAPYEADLYPDDRVRLPQGVYEIEGDPVHQESPTGRLNHTLAQLKRYRSKR